MNSTTLFSMALGLQTPWQVTDISFSEGTPKELHLQINFATGSRFPDATGIACPVHDTLKRT
jgi:transposase